MLIIRNEHFTGTDLILWMLSNMGIGSFHEMDFYNPFADTLAMVTYDEDLLACSLPILDGLLYFFGLISYTMMFNTIFRKNKVVKTILFNMALAFVTVVLTVAVFDTDFVGDVWEMLRNCFDSEEGFIIFWLVFWRIAALLFGFLYLAITYFRIKKVNY